MRIRRIRIRNYRGTDDREVVFAREGVTVVQGPNEVGKSSLAEAMDLIFDHLDSSKKKEVLAVQPVHRDAGAEVEIEVETGAYAFIYFKRFHRKPETTLRVVRPRPESLVGREAHERVRAILEETIDLGLWGALRVQQGDGISQPEFGEQRSLAAALDRAAGGLASGEAEETLFEAIRAEFLRYYTNTGKPGKEIGEAEEEAAAAHSQAEELRARLADLEEKLVRLTKLNGEIERLEKDEEGFEAARKKHDERLAAIGVLEKRLDELRAEREGARHREEIATRDRNDRRALIEALEAARRELAGIEKEAEDGTPALDAARREVIAAETAAAGRQREHEEQKRLLDLRRGDFDFHRDALDLEILKERRSRTEAAALALRAAAEVLGGLRITNDLLAEIESAHLDAETARVCLDAGAPSVELEALSDIAPAVNGEPQPQRRGEIRRLDVGDSLDITLGGVARLTVRAGASAASLAEAHRNARARLESLCAAAGVATAGEARAANEKRKSAERERTESQRALAENLRDLTREELAPRIEDLESRVTAHRGRRGADPPLPGGNDEARTLRDEAEALERKARESRELAEKGLAIARDRRERLEREGHARAALVSMRAEKVKEHSSQLEAARRGKSDEQLEADLKEVSRAARHQEVAVKEAGDRLAAEAPDQVRELAGNSRASLERLRLELGKAREERIALTATLKDRGEQGLAEQIAAAEAREGRAQADLDRLSARARAARLLHDTFAAERERARRAYVAPLKERIEALGRFVFQDSFAVELGADLQVLSRTLAGRTVPFADLSGGAREQIALIARLACAMVVSADGGVPVILDDALGYTDPERLEAMGAVLSRAARDAQVIILTCVPERYRHVGGAQVVKLG